MFTIVTEDQLPILLLHVFLVLPHLMASQFVHSCYDFSVSVIVPCVGIPNIVSNKISFIQFYQWRLWSQILIAQRGRKSTKLTFLFSWYSKRNASSPYCLKKTFKLSVPPFYFLCIFLSVLLTSSYSLCFFPMFTSCQLVASPHLDLGLFNPVDSPQAESSWIKGIC